jgi:hypothetical protein
MILSQFDEAVWHRRGSDCDLAEAWHHGGVSNSLRKGKKRPRETRTLSIFWICVISAAPAIHGVQPSERYCHSPQ